MKNLRIIVLAATLITTGFSGAILADSPVVPLGGSALIPPLGGYPIALDPLTKGLYYNVKCHINNSAKEPVLMRFDVSGSIAAAPTKFLLNGNDISQFHQGTLKSQQNKLEIDGVATTADGAVLTFANLDAKNQVATNGCMAELAVGLNKAKK